MRLKKIILLLGTVFLLNTVVAGCGSRSESAAKTEEKQAGEALPEELNDTPIKKRDGNTEEQWQVLDHDIAAVVDADFLGKVWKIEEDSFFIVEKKIKILDDGSLSYSSPSSKATLPDSQLIHVIFDENTKFYIKTSDGNGENHTYKESGFQDMKEYMSVEMKGSFKNNEFYPMEIRFF